MKKDEHFSLVLRSFNIDSNSWEYDNNRNEVCYRVINKKLDCNIWIANGVFFFAIYRDRWSNSKAYSLNLWEQLKLYFTYLKWKSKQKKLPTEINLNVDDRYVTYLNRYKTIDKILDDL